MLSRSILGWAAVALLAGGHTVSTANGDGPAKPAAESNTANAALAAPSQDARAVDLAEMAEKQKWLAAEIERRANREKPAKTSAVPVASDAGGIDQRAKQATPSAEQPRAKLPIRWRPRQNRLWRR
jgi:hypothetical protein